MRYPKYCIDWGRLKSLVLPLNQLYVFRVVMGSWLEGLNGRRRHLAYLDEVNKFLLAIH